jgi:hypothetical protein
MVTGLMPPEYFCLGISKAKVTPSLFQGFIETSLSGHAIVKIFSNDTLSSARLWCQAKKSSDIHH